MKILFYEDCGAMRHENERDRKLYMSEWKRERYKMKLENVPGASIIQ